MAELPFMPFYINDYLGDTLGLTTEQHGAYVLLIFHYWMSGGPIPDDNETLASVVRMSNERWTSVRTKLERYFQRDGNTWKHPRIDKELLKARGLVAQRKKAGEASVKSRKAIKELNERSNDRSNGDITSAQQRASDSDSLSLISNLSSLEGGAGETFPRADAAPPKQLRSPKDDFENLFWPCVWAKIGKGETRRAFEKARRENTTQKLCDAAKQQGPYLIAAAARDGRSVLHPATWLNQGRFDDEDYDKAIVPAQRNGRKTTDQAMSDFKERMARELSERKAS